MINRCGDVYFQLALSIILVTLENWGLMMKITLVLVTSFAVILSRYTADAGTMKRVILTDATLKVIQYRIKLLTTLAWLVVM